MASMPAAAATAASKACGVPACSNRLATNAPTESWVSTSMTASGVWAVAGCDGVDPPTGGASVVWRRALRYTVVGAVSTLVTAATSTTVTGMALLGQACTQAGGPPPHQRPPPQFPLVAHTPG